MGLLKNFRIILMILLLVIFAYFLISPHITKISGVVVTAVDKDSRCGIIGEGDVITNVLGSVIKNSDEFESVEKTVKVNGYATMVVNNGPGGCTAIQDGYFGISVANISSNEIKFGIDIQGGITTVLKPEKELSKSEIENAVQIINKRIGVYGIPETKAFVSDNFVKINSLSSEKINWLITEGKFEAKILEEVKLDNNTGKIPLGDNSYPVEVVNNSLKVNNSFYRIDDEFKLEDIYFSLKNITNTSSIIEAKIFENNDIIKTIQAGSTSYNTNARSYEFTIPIQISTQASSRFTKIVKKIPTTFIGQKIFLNGFLVYYLDGYQFSQLNIPIELTRQTINQISVIGFSTSMIDASNTKLKVSVAIESGVLPTTFKIFKTEKYEPTLKVFSMEMFGITIGLIAISLLSIFYWRYKDAKSGLLIIVLALLELALIIGTVAAVQQNGATWVINLTTIFGLITVFVISGIQMVISTEKILKKKDMSISYKYKKLTSVPVALNWIFLLISFLLLFTMWRFIGLTLLIGFVFDILIIRPIYNDFLKKKI